MCYFFCNMYKKLNVGNSSNGKIPVQPPIHSHKHEHQQEQATDIELE